MFGKIAADALGLSDIGSVIAPTDYNKVDADDYVMHEDQEKIFFLIKSKSDEYCFTNKALIHLDGTSAASKKRTLRRYNYSAHPVSHVLLETAGNIDMDVEIKFSLGSKDFSIDVHKKHLEQVKDLYKALFRISELMLENEVALGHARASIEVASTTLGRGQAGSTPLVESFKELNQAAFAWLVGAQQKYVVKDFGSVFERYIKA
ncbi:PH domain-containing protein [Archangium violaceum]|uniref:PH domain-containing protein n=1 Tax=Archangium violaceum TaxID=83451 RepID=UPI00193BD0C8|nr:PH domain-containing protein [Archangium violaceum]QRK12430.1 PH domain-containing protein [Archangium violaceum]